MFAIKFRASGLAGGKKEITIDFDRDVIEKIIGKSVFTRTTDPRRPEGGKSYAFIKKDGKPLLLSRVIMNVVGDDSVTVDHINGDSTDNRKENLRLCKISENAKNRRLSKNNVTGFKGVSVCNGKYRPKFTATIGYEKNIIVLIRTNDPEEAAYVYDQVALQLHGKYAKTNFIYDDSTSYLDSPTFKQLK